MSETDDTDVLLLIPPDFFLVRSSGSEESLLESSRTVVHKPQSCTAQVIGKLVDQVHSLESRLESLEISTTITDSSFGTVPRHKWDTDTDSRSLDSKYFTFPRRRRRKVLRKQKNHDLSLNSLDSRSTGRGIPRLKLKEFQLASIHSKSEAFNDSPSMDGDLSSITSTPSKKNDKLLLNEIDEFLTKVEAYETPDERYKDLETTANPENLIQATSAYLTEKHDLKSDEIRLPSGRILSSGVLDKYIYLVKSNTSTADSEKAVPSTSASKSDYNEETTNTQASDTPKPADIPKPNTDTRSPSIRRLNFEKDVQPTSTPKKTQSSYLDTFKPSSNKIYNRASKVLEQYKSNYSRNDNLSTQNVNQNPQNTLTESYKCKEEFKMPQMRPFVFETKESSKNKYFESIDTDLLSLSELWGDRESKGERGDGVKLEEERLKREHCESIIQQLQKKVLDQQEKLAVAIKVDRAKDNAITKLREAWVKLTGSLERAEERHRQALDKMLREAENFKQVACEAQKKTNHFETELYKALDLAHDYQDKCKQLGQQLKDFEEQTERSLADKDEVIARKDKEIEVLKDNYETVMSLNKQSTDCVRNLEDTLEKERSDHDQTKSRVNELLRKLSCKDDEGVLVAQERDLLREKVNEERSRASLLEGQLTDRKNENCELVKKCDALDSEVKSLRNLLEIQKNELKTHYQKQLEDAVLAKLQEFQQQLEAAEREMENEARGKENAIVDTFNKQFARIEEQHRLEVNVLEEKQSEEIKLYRLQLAQASEKIGLLEQKLESYRRRRGQLATQLHGVMEAQWRQALLILTNGHGAGSSAPTEPAHAVPQLDLTRPDSVYTPVAEKYEPAGAKYDPAGSKYEPAGAKYEPAGAKYEPGALAPAPAHRGARRPDRDLLNFEGLSDTELQQYVKLLLNKPAPLPGGGGDAEEPTSDRPRRRHNAHKPPWKA